MPYRIVNIIASTNIGEILDLYKVSNENVNSYYKPDSYIALKYFIKKPKITILVHKKGKIIFTGAKSLEDIKTAKKIFFDDLKKIGYNPIDNDIKIDNLVIVSQLKNRINIEKIFMVEKNYTIQYEPEIFPGAIIKSLNPKFTLLLFGSGKFSIVGLKELKLIPSVINVVKKLFEE